MSKYHCHMVKFHFAPENVAEAYEVLHRMYATVPTEPKTLLYTLLSPPGNNRNIYVYEVYDGADGFKHHTTTEIHDGVMVDIQRLIAAPWDIYWLDFAYGKGIPAS